MKTKEAVTIIVFVTALACSFQTSFAAVSDTSCNTTSDCTANAWCVFQECQCKPGYKDSGLVTCISVYNSLCTVDSDCSNLTNSVCTGLTGTIQCKCKSGYKYDEATLQCVKVLGGGCEEPVDCTMTVNNSLCAGTPNECSCMSGYTEMSDLCVEVSSSVLWQPSCLLLAIAMLMVILGIEI